MEHLFHSQLWVKRTPLHLIVDNGSQKNLISVEVIKILKLLTVPHPQPYNIGWLSHGQGIRVSQQCCLSYGIKPFKDEVICDVAPLEVCDVILGQPYMWKRNAVYESRPRSVIITLGKKLYRIPETLHSTAVSLITAKQCRKVIFQRGKFVLFMVHSEGGQNIIETSTASTQNSSVDVYVTSECISLVFLIYCNPMFILGCT